MKGYKNHFEKVEKIKSGEISLRQNVNYFLKRIEENSNLNCYNFVFNDCIEQADIIEEKIKNGKAGKLAGMVIAIKDVLALKDKPMTCSSNILKNFISIYTSTAVQKLINEDAIIIGKTNCDEFAMGSSNENSAFGPALNPHDATRVTGGSSGGSAAAVAADLCDVSLGTDTGGSIRQPAAFCGIFGLKPTYGRVSRYGLTAFASSFDTIGPFAKSIEDIALVLEVISGKDEKDSTSQDTPVPEFSKNILTDKKFKIGIPKEYFGEGLDSEIKDAINNQIEKLKSNGHQIIEISLPHTEYAIATYYILTTAEASSNLSRYEGAHYGYRAEQSGDLIDMYTETRTQGFGKEVKRRIMLGTYVLSAGYYDAYYRKAQKVRRLLKNDFTEAFKSVDVILTPTTPTVAFKIGEKSSNPLEMYLSDIYTTSANLAGIPGINIPITKNKNGLPIGMQLMANQFEELKLLQLSKVIESLK
ncbi:MAG: Asp-tRNA(Asn)/Glu-tRNA(Gln) amidotransferase subunit GatA [Melioribacter sp.]|uniref:Asp-tRNA(Asn)/Glu-tRNA(Gln) amidotransferase subunit GatA n=1 Tax=Rosettibacter primus TaxID=3111523 RepID=UPI00247C811D|nr:Asp-tRNA(Asn)/Glu-tRNA(Gln) amidotransferase subunit GatA [Melioribacter sp.]